MAEAIERAAAALQANDPAAAREALLEQWRARRSPLIGELLGLLDLRQRDEVREALDAVLGPRVNASYARFEPLSSLDDPRVSAFALEQLERLPFTSPNAEPLLLAFVQTVRRARDTRLLARAEAIREGVRTRLTRAPVRDAILQALDATVARLRTEPVPESTEAELALRERLAPLQQAARSEAALLDTVYARPADDGPRLVYADWLLERGDPRGEFIMLQFKRRGGALLEADAAREKALLAKHGKRWLGALAPVASFGKGYARTTFERGFVSTVDIILSVGKKLEPLWTAREWRTVECLEGTWPNELLERAPLVCLKRIDRTFGDAQLVALAKGGRTLPAEAVELDASGSWPHLKDVFPKLRTVSLWWTGVPTLDELRRLAGLGLHRLELRRAWNSPRGLEDHERFRQLLTALETEPLPLEELALMPAWNVDRDRPPLIELRRSGEGFASATGG